MAVVVTDDVANRRARSVRSPVGVLLLRQVDRLILDFQVEPRHLVLASVTTVGRLRASSGCAGLQRLPVGDPEIILVARRLAVLVRRPDGGY